MPDSNSRPTPTPVWFKGQQADDWVTRFTVGEDPHWDTFLLPYDIEASKAHARGLFRAGVLTDTELSELETALTNLARRARNGDEPVRPEDEDCHTVIERFLTKHLGETGRKIHTGRSRNDQVMAALRLWLRDALDRIVEATVVATEELLDFAEREKDTPLPGYTHLQRAMPSTVAAWAGGFAELLVGDIRLLKQTRDNINRNPLGSAAGYGVPHLDLPTGRVAKELGFRDAHRMSTSVQLSRGKYELQVGHALVQLAATINRLASDCVLYASAEFGFFRLPDSMCTGSSIMPQKKNPDVFELARATVHRINAEMTLLLTLPANLPSGYHRDLQLTKEAVMRAVQRTEDLVYALQHMTPELQVDRDAIQRALTPELWATAAANRQVREGVPFRDAYRAVAAEPELWAEERKKHPGYLDTSAGPDGALKEVRDLLASTAGTDTEA